MHNQYIKRKCNNKDVKEHCKHLVSYLCDSYKFLTQNRIKIIQGLELSLTKKHKNTAPEYFNFLFNIFIIFTIQTSDLTAVIHELHTYKHFTIIQ